MSSEDDSKFELIELGALAERTKLKISFNEHDGRRGYYIHDKNGLVVDKYYGINELLAFLKGCDYAINNKG